MAARYRVRLGLAYITTLSAIFFSLTIPFLLGYAIDRLVVTSEDGQILALGDAALRALVWIAVGLLGVTLLRGISEFARTYTTDSLSQKVAYDVRNSFYDKLQHLSFGYHDKEHTGDLMSKATADMEAVRRFVMMGLVRSLEVVLLLIALPLFLLWLNWELALISMAFVPFLVFRASVVAGRLRRMWDRAQIAMGDSVTTLQENLAGMQVVKAFAAEDHEIKKFKGKAQQIREEYFQSERLQGTESARMTLYFSLALGLILWYGGWEVIRGDLTPGGLTMFVLYLNRLSFPVRMTPFVINSFSRAASSGQRLFDVLDAQSPVQEKPDARDMGRAKGHVRFEEVSFSYDSRVPSLKNVSISVPPGSVVALLGAPGSGKTTIVNLLPRFYEVTQGRVTIDGVDLREFTLASLRQNVGIVQQDVYLFSATIRDNLAYGDIRAPFEDIVKAAKVAQLHEHIMSLPDRYDTWVGERGSTLSGGQRQRLSIARTILIDPPVLILDDSTSSVDVETERLIHRAMTQVMEGRTNFVVAHRLSTVRQADLIMVLKDGEIAERGTHDELIGSGGIYREIYELQLRPQEEVLLDTSMGIGGIVRGETMAGGNGGDN